MKIIIVGCGKVGTTLAEHLFEEGHDITVIDRHPEKLKTLSDRIDVLGVVGNGASISTQREAGVASADIFIVTTDSDELNLLCCLIAKKAGNLQTIARIRNPEYYNESRYIRDELNLSMVINPEQAAAEEIARIIKFPFAMKVDTFARGRVELIKLRIPRESLLDGMALSQMDSKLHCKVLICMVEREEEIIIPHGDFVLKGDDIVSFIAPHATAISFFAAAGTKMTGSIKSILFVGGGNVCYYAAKLLEETKITVKIIERDFERCNALSSMLPKAIIINGDGTDKKLLEEEGLKEVDAIGNLTGIDEENILLSLHATENTDAKVLTKINRVTFEDVISKLNIGSVINSNSITADNIVSFVRALNNSRGSSNVETLYKIGGGRAEALEFRVKTDKSVVGKPLMQLKLKPSVIVACIVKNGVAVTPNGQSVIENGDTVIVVSAERGLQDIEDILA